MARRAGRYAASNATAANAIETATNVAGSSGVRPTSIPWRYRVDGGRPGQAGRDADERDERALTEHEDHHRGRPGTERHADADFARPLRHRVRHHAVDADRREGAGHAGEDAEQHRVEAQPRNPVGHHLLHRGDVEETRLGVELPCDLTHVRNDRRRVRCRPRREIGSQREHRGPRPLADLRKDLRLGVEIQSRLPNVGDDPHDLPRNRVRPGEHLPADDALAGEVAPREHLVDEQHPRLPGAIGLPETASREHLDAHHVQVVAADQADFRSVRLLRDRRRFPEPRRLAEADHRQLSVRGGQHSRYCSDPGDQIVRKHLQPGERIPPRGERDLERQHVFRLVPGVHARQLEETVHQQRASREHHHRQRDLDAHEQRSRAAAPQEAEAGIRGRRAFAERVDREAGS